MIINLSRKISNLLDNCQKFAHTLSWNACTWHEFDDLTFLWSVNKLARSATKMDSSMWPTISEADFLHSSHKRFPTILSCGKHGPALQTGFVSRLRLCWWSWRLNINLWWSLVSFWKYNISSSQLDVQETDCCLAQFYKVCDYFSGCRIAYGWVTCPWFLGQMWLKYYAQPATMSNPNIHAFRKLVRLFIPKPRPRKSKEDRRLINWVMWIMCPSTHSLLKMSLCCTFLKTTRPWSRWL